MRPEGHDADSLGRLIRAGRSAEVIGLAEEAIVHAPDDSEIARILLKKLAALLNAGRSAECPAVLDRANEVLSRCDEPVLRGDFHALAANLAFNQGSLYQCITHLVRGGRALEQARQPDEVAALAWIDLAVTYSSIGFHGHAVNAHQRAKEIAEPAGLDPADFAHPEIRVRLAVSMDHQGDADACVSVLREVVDALRPDDVAAYEMPYLGYASARLAAMGVQTDRDARPLLWADIEPHGEITELRQLAEVCLAIADGQPEVALARLELADECVRPLGVAEVPRLRSIAHAAAGDYRAAASADREVARELARHTNRLHGLFVEGVSARLDHDELRLRATQYADEAHTDPLTGLPNRRHLERYVDELARHGTEGAIGVADLDGFKMVNTIHGHLSGDQVLQRVAAILTRTLRTGDFLARYGGDEFVIVLASTGLAEAVEIGERLAAAVAGDDWETLVPGTPVKLTVGWAELNGRTGIQSAFRAADMMMLQAKGTS